MSELLLDKIREILEPIINDQGLLLDNLKYVKKGREYYLEIYVEKEDDVTTLDEVCAVSDLLSKKLDEVDLIQDNYVLDVSTSGAEKPIKDFSMFPKYVGKYVFVKLRNPVNGKNDYTGTIESATSEKIVLSYKEKTRTKTVELQIDNITRSNLAIKF